MLGEQVHSATIFLCVLVLACVFSLVVDHTKINGRHFSKKLKTSRNSHISIVIDSSLTGSFALRVLFDVIFIDSNGASSERDLTVFQSVIVESNRALTVDLSKQHKNKESRSKERWQDGGSRAQSCRSLSRSRSVVEPEEHDDLLLLLVENVD
uniref:Uncharacterized protein n=1 Tax=Meloidogyne incognita TaxID=6306 RepID=A0A914LRY7_MELIC